MVDSFSSPRGFGYNNIIAESGFYFKWFNSMASVAGMAGMAGVVSCQNI